RSIEFHFVVQRSVDGIQWIGIGQIMAAGFSVLHRNYNFTDHAPLSCTSYYRLRMVDLDGSNDFSSVRVVDAASENSHWINVFPNPVSDWITLKSIDDKPISGIEIYDVAGRKVREVAHSVGASLTIDVSDLPPGTYYFVYNQGSRPGVSPFVRYQ
ncbi:MAG TPA: T9SS type A sorting domain-containing protein, partial [Flavobacteriales bacterium]|nr:T9SS type A sorting domain-containing protein [Flavobacteriales bacterium]